MKLRILFLLTLSTAAFVAAQIPSQPTFQSPAPPPDSQKTVPPTPITPETVVVTVDGKSYTAKEMDEMMNLLPPQGKAAIKQNTEAALTQLFLLYYVSEDGKKRKLDQMAPYKDAIESQSRSYLANIAVQDENTHIRVSEAEQQAYYAAHPDQYQSVKISAIYVAFTPNPKPGPDGKMPQTEAQAKVKAEALVKKLRAGANFAQVAKESSEDKETAAKGGEYATIRKSDEYPKAIKDTIFTLKDNEISDPVQQPAGFYIFKVTGRTTQAFAEVQTALFEKVKTEKFDEWLKSLRANLAPKIENPEYFGGGKVPAPANATPIPVPIAADSVVATVGGKPYTAKEMDAFMKLLPPQAKAEIAKNPEVGLTELFMIVQLSEEARKRKLDQESPHKEMLERMSREATANAVINDHVNGITVTPAEQDAFYKSHQEQFETAKVSAIMVSFSANPKPGADGKTQRSEDEAKARAEDLVKQLRGGADFAGLAKANSDDKDSAEKGGEYAMVRRADAKIPAPMKNVVFGLKDGDVSDPVRQGGGFYIFKTTAKIVQPLAEVATTAVVPAVKQEKFKQWIAGLQAQYKPKIEKPEYFKK